MKLHEVPYWLADRDADQYRDLLSRDVTLDWTQSQEDTLPFDDTITELMVPLYRKVGCRAFPPVIMAPAELCLGVTYPNGWGALTGAHRLRAAFLAGIELVPAWLVLP